MRLGQLSRQLDVDTNKIVRFLVSEKFEIENSPNTKLAEDQIKLVETHFTAKKAKALEAKKAKETSIPNKIEIESAFEPTAQEEVESKKEVPTKIDLSKFETKSKHQTTSKEKNFFPAEDPQEDEIINAELLPTEKITLGGIKVVGKIDLPEKQKKPSVVKEEQTVNETTDNNKESTSESVTTATADETHPLKKAKLIGVKNSITVKKKASTIDDINPKKPFKGIKAKEIKAKKKEQEKKNSKKLKKEFIPKKEEITNTTREARQRKKERQKEATLNQKEKKWWVKLWESFSL